MQRSLGRGGMATGKAERNEQIENKERQDKQHRKGHQFDSNQIIAKCIHIHEIVCMIKTSCYKILKKKEVEAAYFVPRNLMIAHLSSGF